MTQKFEFKEQDSEGLENLNVIAKADKFNSWMYDTIQPYCKGNILEIGSGIGNISMCFLENKKKITLSDIRESYVLELRQKFKSYSSLTDVILLDLVCPDFEIKYESFLESFDTIFALNVVEHIENDELAIRNCKKLLKKNGTLIILVPAYQRLYNVFDKELYHYRRYTKKTLNPLFINEQLQIVSSKYFNAAGILGWFVSGKIQKNKTLPKGQMSLFNALVPLFKLFDKIVLNKIGLSVITVAKKK